MILRAMNLCKREVFKTSVPMTKRSLFLGSVIEQRIEGSTVTSLGWQTEIAFLLSIQTWTTLLDCMEVRLRINFQLSLWDEKYTIVARSWKIQHIHKSVRFTWQLENKLYSSDFFDSFEMNCCSEIWKFHSLET